jgi:hypothetical protein
MSASDEDISTWSDDDLLRLIGLDGSVNADEINDALDDAIEKARESGDLKAASFLDQASNRLLGTSSTMQGVKTGFSDQASDQLLNWWQNQYLTQDNTRQSDKVTNRQNQIEIFDDGSHAQMKQNTLGVNQAYDLPHVQGTINPTLRNEVERMVIIDSQYRPNVYPYAGDDQTAPSFSTDFSVSLSENLSSVLSMELYSVQIPRAWYNVCPYNGNSCLSYKEGTNAEVILNVPSGNYTANTLCTYLNSIANGVLSFVTNSTTERVTITNTSIDDVVITFYRPEGFDSIECAQCNTTSYSNTSLGWTLGDRTQPIVSGDDVGSVMLSIEAGDVHELDTTPSLEGPQYGLVVVDDFNKNRPNKGVVGIVETDNRLDMPEYTNADNLSCQNGEVSFVMTAPRKLTRKQLYTINTIVQGRKASKERLTSPSTNDVMGVIPLMGEGDISLYGSSLMINKRTYFGPVSIERLRVRLVDNRGNLINLNGRDWSITLKIKQLYQY